LSHLFFFGEALSRACSEALACRTGMALCQAWHTLRGNMAPNSTRRRTHRGHRWQNDTSLARPTLAPNQQQQQIQTQWAAPKAPSVYARDAPRRTLAATTLTAPADSPRRPNYEQRAGGRSAVARADWLRAPRARTNKPVFAST
jgi:hypothetical protein